jgi:FixJ family two-component response regulator
LSKPILVSIVDDDKAVRDALDALVRSLGYPTCTFGSAEEFLGSAFAAATSCLVCDVRMPGMNAAELQSCLRSQGIRLPIIFIAADPFERLRGNLLEAGAVDVLLKPFDGKDLLASMQRALRSA